MMSAPRRTRGLLAAAIVACGACAVPLAAQADVRFVDGGKWDYGSDSGWVWSRYSHGGVDHAASADGKQHYDSGCRPAGETAVAEGSAKTFGINKSYYRHC